VLLRHVGIRAGERRGGLIARLEGEVAHIVVGGSGPFKLVTLQRGRMAL
jgi:hypothetical protein